MDDPFALDDHYVTSPTIVGLFGIAPRSSLLSDSPFLVEEKSDLLTTKVTRRPQPNSIDTGRELLALCRWILTTSALGKPEAALRPFCSQLVIFFAQEWRKSIDRMRFQAEESLYAQLPGMSDLFSTLAALMVAAEKHDMVGHHPLLTPIKGRFIRPSQGNVA